MVTFIVTILLLWLIGRIIVDHCYANKWRELIRILNTTPPPPSIPGWLITYTERGKPKSIKVPGASEGEALKNAITNSVIDIKHIVSIVKE